MSTLKVSGVPCTATADDLLAFFSTTVGSPAVACDIAVSRRGWLPRTDLSSGDITASVQFFDADAAEKVMRLLHSGKLPPFGANQLEISICDDVIPRASDVNNRVEEARLLVGNRQKKDTMEVIQSWDGVRVEIMPERARIDMYLEDKGQKYKLEVFFQDIISSYGCKISNEGASDAILLELRYAPRIFIAMDISKKSLRHKRETYYKSTGDLQSPSHWIRSQDFTHNSSFGKSTSLCINVKHDSSYKNILKSRPFRAEIENLNLFLNPEEKEIACDNNCVQLYPLLEISNEVSVPYEILFQLNSLVHMHKLPSECVNEDLLNTLNGLSVDICLKILKRMHKLEDTCYDPLQFVKLQSSEILKGKQRDSMSEGRLMHCYRVLITPTKVYLQGPELENSNYIVKHFAKYSSDFIRVTFVDEDWSKLPYNSISTKIEQGVLSRPIKTGIHARILSVLKHGFKISSKKFEFLAFSASQLRGNSVWMFASNNEVTTANIRDFMGQFANIRSISKCAARMGQLFSSSSQTIDVPSWEVTIIPDIEICTNGNKYNFSDGIGKISPSFASQISRKLGLSHTPSAFQIRYGGFKGVVAVDRTSFNLSLRLSMKKFESQSTMLNITKFSTYQMTYLNREIITLLSTLGIADEVFDEIQREHLGLLSDIFSSRESALKTVQKIYGGYSSTIVNMLTQGYEPCLEPYLFMVLKAQREYQLADIKSKCRIFVPKGRVLVGCLDEMGKLEYGQVYLRVTLTKDELREKGYFRNFDGKTGVVEGKVMVTKNPCLHPGDVRVLDAVLDADLDGMGLVDCLVFPQKGERPHPNECSGGDLDGDLYFIAWDERLIPPETDPPMDYSGPRQRIMDHDVTLEEIQNFFVDYMTNDNLGAISTAHLVHADREPLKARSPKCIELAQLHSMSVDFAKTGSPAEMPRVLKPKEFPDFMERYDKPMYRSNGVLGCLYRGFLSYIGSVKKQVECEVGYFDSDLMVEGFEGYLEDAEEFYKMYDEKFGNLMCYYKAEKEEEIVTGNLANKALYLKKDNKQYGELKDRILVAFKGLQREAEDWFKNSCSESDYSKMASAWYHVTYRPDFTGTDKKRFLSFAWVNSDMLLGIKADKRKKKKLQELLEEGMREKCDNVGTSI